MNDPLLDLIRLGTQSNRVRVAEGSQPRLTPLEGIKAVVFDIYGTVFSSGAGDISLAGEVSNARIIRDTLADNGIAIEVDEMNPPLDTRLHDMIRTHQEKRRNEGVEFPEVEIRSVWKDFLDGLISDLNLSQSDYPGIDMLVVDFERRVNPIRIMPDFRELIDYLQREKLVTSIISNAQFYTPLMFDAFFGKSLKDMGFCEKCSVWSYKLLEGKPSRELYKQAASNLLTHHGITPDQVLYVGNDMRNDIWPAQAIGFHTALFSGDHLSLRRREDDPDCEGVIPTIEITRLMQIAECI
jgi:putative hydrolase of the HAD superfamily